MSNEEDLIFKRYKFQRSTDGDNNPRFGDKGEPVYAKTFVTRHEWISFYQIMSSRDPITLEYSLWLNRPETPAWNGFSDAIKNSLSEKLEEHLDVAVKCFKQSVRIPEEVKLELKLDLKYILAKCDSANLRVRGTNFGQLYDSFETILIRLGYINGSLLEEREVRFPVATLV